jgi:uncharacterized repeat protein (TIGR01451 family)
MKTRTTQRRPFWAALAVVASLFLALLITAPGVGATDYGVGAGAKILNTVQIDYKDASGTTPYSANASTYVTVNLVKAAPTFSGRPTSGAPGKTAACPSNLTIDSGAHQTYLIALTANANGGDSYSLTSNFGTVTNMASDQVTWSTMRNDGTNTITTGSPSSVVLGASVIQANDATTISIPGGSTLAAAIQTNAAGYKVLVVNGVDYKVDSITTGTAPSNTHVGATPYNDLGTATPEALAVISLSANTFGANATPSFGTNALKGTVAAEQILIRLDYTGVVGSTPGADGIVEFYMTSDNGATSCHITTTFHASNMMVEKYVTNCGPSAGSCGSFTASATGNPGDILEYEVLVHNAGSSVAASVKAKDAIPIYTTLVCGAAGLGSSTCGAGGIFATIKKNAGSAANITVDQDADACGSGIGSGWATAYTEGSPLYFLLGTGCDYTQGTNGGGSAAASDTFEIHYRVKMN